MKLKRILLLVTVFCCLGYQTYAQRVTIDAEKTRLEQILDEISSQTGCSFYYSRPTVDSDSLCTVKAENEELDKVLDALFSKTRITYDMKEDKIYLIARTEDRKQSGQGGGIIYRQRQDNRHGGPAGNRCRHPVERDFGRYHCRP